MRLIPLEALIPTGPLRTLFTHTLQSPLERLLRVRPINERYQEISRRLQQDPHANFFETCLDVFDVQLDITRGSLERIPTTGPVMVLSNHPFGGLDGIALGALLTRSRPDAQLIANGLLARMPEIARHIIQVDPFQTNASTKANYRGTKDWIAALKSGKLIGCFPSGYVSHYQKEKGRIADLDWNPIVARIAEKTGATIVPVHFSGQNRPLFHQLGRIHPRLRTLLLPAEMDARSHSTLDLRIGNPIHPGQNRHLPDAATRTRYFQMRSQVLATDEVPTRQDSSSQQGQHIEPLAEPTPTDLLLQDLASLPPACLLDQKGPYQVYSATADQMPHLMQEIGRVREATFRTVGEGIGKARDLTDYDQRYHQLFLWNNETCEIIGGYRIGIVDEIIAAHGLQGLYSHTVIDYSEDAFPTLGKTLELGRSYITPAYQKQGTSLYLLWRGIMRFVMQRPEYTKLYGTVCISDDYQPLSKSLMLAYLRTHKLAPGWTDKIKARHRADYDPPKSLALFNYPQAFPKIDHLTGLIGDIEPDGKGIPPLLKYYLGLNGIMLGFGIDKGFGNALDGFVNVDLTQVPKAILKKYGATEEYFEMTRGVEAK